MRLCREPFDMIRAGKKTYELRLFDEKRRNISIGDTICFTVADGSDESFECEVTSLSVFSSFAELYCSLPLDKCGYDEYSLPYADPSDMGKYYSLEEQIKYGVIAIGVNNRF